MRLQYHHRYSIVGLCGLFDNSRQAYYDRCRYQAQAGFADDAVLSLVRSVRKDFPRMGARKLLVYLSPQFSKMGLTVGRDSFLDILSRHSLLIRQVRSKRKTTYSSHWMRKYSNLIKGYTPTGVNQLWVSDITYVESNSGFSYLSLITDAYSHKIVGWNVATSLNSINAIRALNMALGTLPSTHTGLIHHSDRGVQYCCGDYVELLRSRGISISMTESGDPLENAVAERINGILKTEWLYHTTITSAQQVKSYISHIIGLYNEKRPHQSIGYLTPAYVHETGVSTSRRWKNYYSTKEKEINNISLSLPAILECQAISGLKTEKIESVKLYQDINKNKGKNCKVITGRHRTTHRTTHTQ